MQISNRRCFQQRGNDSLINRLNNYISPVDFDWIKKIKPADDSQIYKLRKVLGMEEIGLNFPESFLEFAKVAGEEDGGLLSKTLRGKFSISDLIEFNEEIYNYEKESLTPYYFEFLTDEVGMSYAIMLNNNKENGVYYENTCFISSSFENLLFQCAVQRYEEKYFKMTLKFGSSINSLAESFNKRKGVEPFELMDQICDRYDLKRAWFSDDFFYFAYSDKISILLLNDEAVATAGKISGDDELVKVLADDLLPKIGAKLQKF